MLRILGYLLSNALVIFLVIRYIPELGFSLQPAASVTVVNIIIIGLIFGLINGVIKSILEFLLLPLKIISLGLLSLPIAIGLTIGVFYLFQWTVAYLNIGGIQVVLGNIVQILLLSIVMGILNFIIKKIL